MTNIRGSTLSSITICFGEPCCFQPLINCMSMGGHRMVMAIGWLISSCQGRRPSSAFSLPSSRESPAHDQGKVIQTHRFWGSVIHSDTPCHIELLPKWKTSSCSMTSVSINTSHSWLVGDQVSHRNHKNAELRRKFGHREVLITRRRSPCRLRVDCQVN